MSAHKPKPKRCTPQQEAFARWVVRGLSYAAAYRRSYVVGEKTLDSTVQNNASALARSTVVSARIAELTAQAAKRAGVTKESMLAEMQHNREFALDAGELSVAATSSRDRARVAGLLKDKVELSGTGDEGAIRVETETTIEERSMNEIARRIAFTLQKGMRAKGNKESTK